MGPRIDPCGTQNKIYVKNVYLNTLASVTSIAIKQIK